MTADAVVTLLLDAWTVYVAALALAIGLGVVRRFAREVIGPSRAAPVVRPYGMGPTGVARVVRPYSAIRGLEVIEL